jgi:hypothetical protein
LSEEAGGAPVALPDGSLPDAGGVDESSVVGVDDENLLPNWL